MKNTSTFWFFFVDIQTWIRVENAFWIWLSLSHQALVNDAEYVRIMQDNMGWILWIEHHIETRCVSFHPETMKALPLHHSAPIRVLFQLYGILAHLWWTRTHETRNTIKPTSSPLRYSMEVVIKAQWLPVDLHTSWTDSLLLGECPWRWQQNCIQELCNEPETYEVVVNHPSSVKCFYKVIQTLLWSYNTPSVSAGCRCEPHGHCLQRPTICHPHWQLISEWPDGNLEEDKWFLEELSYTFAFIWSKYSKIVIMWNVTAI